MTSTPTDLRVTPLHGLHRELGGRLVPFAGWELPIQYEGVIAEHTACRTAAALFDVSHMGIVDFGGASPDEVAARLETITPAGITTLKPGRQRYSLLTTDGGGVIDDCIFAHYGDRLSVVVNASRRDVDLARFRDGLDGLDVIERTDLALLALQGPQAAAALGPLLGGSIDGRVDLTEVSFGQHVVTTVTGDDGAPIDDVRIFRGGYTGEDGFELMVDGARAESLARALLARPEVAPAGLGARDTLRLEAGLALYGNDLDDTTSPVEAGLVWTIPKRRREAGGFPGHARVATELADGPSRVRVGLKPQGRRPVRDGAAVTTVDGTPVGTVTSGGFGPTVEGPVAMGYVAPEHAEVGTELVADVRGKPEPITVADLPFTPHRYFRAPTPTPTPGA
ncbi:MAG: glycine cleavage system aminomethyltransferase GcvT [Actinomycetota bacterium]